MVCKTTCDLCPPSPLTPPPPSRCMQVILQFHPFSNLDSSMFRRKGQTLTKKENQMPIYFTPHHPLPFPPPIFPGLWLHSLQVITFATTVAAKHGRHFKEKIFSQPLIYYWQNHARFTEKKNRNYVILVRHLLRIHINDLFSRNRCFKLISCSIPICLDYILTRLDYADLIEDSHILNGKMHQKKSFVC